MSEFRRMRAAIKQARSGDTTALRADIERRISELEAEVKDWRSHLDYLDHKAVVREGWLLPLPPDDKHEWELIVALDGADAYAMWERDDYEYVDIRGDDWWPFEGDTAYAEDFEACGFRVEMC